MKLIEYPEVCDKILFCFNKSHLLILKYSDRNYFFWHFLFSPQKKLYMLIICMLKKHDFENIPLLNTFSRNFTPQGPTLTPLPNDRRTGLVRCPKGAQQKPRRIFFLNFPLRTEVRVWWGTRRAPNRMYPNPKNRRCKGENHHQRAYPITKYAHKHTKDRR